MAVLGRSRLTCSEHHRAAAWAGLGIQAEPVWAGRGDTAGRAVQVLYSAAGDTAEGLKSPLWL